MARITWKLLPLGWAKKDFENVGNLVICFFMFSGRVLATNQPTASLAGYLLPRWCHISLTCLFQILEETGFPILSAVKSMIITKLAGLFTSWINIEKHVHSWTQYKYNRHSVCHMRGMRVGICACEWVGLPLLEDKKSLTILKLIVFFSSVFEWLKRGVFKSKIVLVFP